jgi:hypothetical protein
MCYCVLCEKDTNIMQEYLIYLENGGIGFLRNDGTFLLECTARSSNWEKLDISKQLRSSSLNILRPILGQSNIKMQAHIIKINYLFS